MATKPSSVAEKQTTSTTADDTITRVSLWCVPRAVSTSFLKCMTYVPDSQVWLGPYESIREFSKSSEHREMILQLLVGNWECETNQGELGGHIEEGYLAADKTRSWLKEQLESTLPGKKFIFTKDMAVGLEGHYEDLPEGFRHTFLIRHPYRVFNSWERMTNRGVKDESKKIRIVNQPECLIPKGKFFKEIYDLYLHVKENFESNPVIIDTDDLLENPERVLKAYCKAIGITYSDDLLKWKPGRECMDELWMVAKEMILAQNTGNFHKETFASTGFGKLTKCPERSELHEDVLSLSDPCMKYYEEMYENRLKC